MMYKIRIISVARPRNTFKLLLLAPTFGAVTESLIPLFGLAAESLAVAFGAAAEPVVPAFAFGVVNGSLAAASSSTTKAQRKRSIGVAVK